jgi:hypothetical protein
MTGKPRRMTRKRAPHHGGATNRLPGISEDTTLAEFEAEWDVFYIAAHGALLSKNITVPRDTYILNTVPSLSACRLKRTDRRLNKFYENKYNANFMNFIRNPKTLVESLYNANILTLMQQYNANEINPKTSIYEPTDEVHDMIFSFKSHIVPSAQRATRGHTHFAAAGIFKLPISSAAKELKARHWREIGLLSLAGTTPNAEMTEKLQAANTEYMNIPENIIGKIIASSGGQTEFTLSTLMGRPELQPTPGKKRFIIVHSCKRLHGINKNTAKQIRAESRGRIIASAFKRSNALGQFERAKAKLMNKNTNSNPNTNKV